MVCLLSPETQTKAPPSHAGCLQHYESQARGSKRVAGRGVPALEIYSQTRSDRDAPELRGVTRDSGYYGNEKDTR